jgi:hypothetical protein
MPVYLNMISLDHLLARLRLNVVQTWVYLVANKKIDDTRSAEIPALRMKFWISFQPLSSMQCIDLLAVHLRTKSPPEWKSDYKTRCILLFYDLYLVVIWRSHFQIIGRPITIDRQGSNLGERLTPFDFFFFFCFLLFARTYQCIQACKFSCNLIA